MKKITFMVITLVLAFGFAFAGGSNEDDGVVKISLTMWDEVQAPVIQKNIDRFNELNAGKIEASIELVPWSNYWTKLDASLGTSQTADVMWMNVYLRKYVEGGVMLPLDDLVSAENYDLDQYVQARVDAYKLNGNMYCLPKGLDAVFVALNTEIFEKYGVDLPSENWTWEDMVAIADELKAGIDAANGTEYPIAMELDAQPSYRNFVVQNGWYNLDVEENVVGVGDEKYNEAIFRVVSLMENEQMAPYTVLSETKGTDIFISEQAAIVFVGSWKAAVLENSSLGQRGGITLIQMPINGESNRSTLGGLGYGIAKNSKHPQEAWELIKFLTNEESLRAEATAGIDFPANIDAQSSYVENFKNINAQVISDATLTGFPFQANGNVEWMTTVDDAIQLVFSGRGDESTLLEVKEEAQEIINEAFGINK